MFHWSCTFVDHDASGGISPVLDEWWGSVRELELRRSLSRKCEGRSTWLAKGKMENLWRMQFLVLVHVIVPFDGTPAIR